MSSPVTAAGVGEDPPAWVGAAVLSQWLGSLWLPGGRSGFGGDDAMMLGRGWCLDAGKNSREECGFWVLPASPWVLAACRLGRR